MAKAHGNWSSRENHNSNQNHVKLFAMESTLYSRGPIIRGISVYRSIGLYRPLVHYVFGGGREQEESVATEGIEF